MLLIDSLKASQIFDLPEMVFSILAWQKDNVSLKSITTDIITDHQN